MQCIEQILHKSVSREERLPVARAASAKFAAHVVRSVYSAAVALNLFQRCTLWRIDKRVVNFYKRSYHQHWRIYAKWRPWQGLNVRPFQ